MFAIPGSQILEFRLFSPILNPGNGDIPIPGFLDLKKLVKIVLFLVLSDANINCSRQMKFNIHA